MIFLKYNNNKLLLFYDINDDEPMSMGFILIPRKYVHCDNYPCLKFVFSSMNNINFSDSFSCSGNGRLASCTTILGFIVMMSLDVGLG